jgi:hypothetical protein
MAIKYRRTKGRPATAIRHAPDERLERSKRWERVEPKAAAEAAPAKAAPAKSTPAAPAGEKKEK